MIAFAFITIAGLPISRVVDRDAPWLRSIAVAFLLGTGELTLAMFALSLAGIRWSALSIGVAMIIISAPFLLRANFKGVRIERVSFIALITLVMLIGYARYATAAPAWELDFIDNWGLKGRVFFEHAGIDWDFLTNAWYRWSHQDYPPLVPFVYDFVSLTIGEWNDRLPSLFYPLAAGAALLLIQSLLTDELKSTHVAALTTLALASLIATPWIGLGDGPFIAFAIAGLLLIRAGSFAAGALLLGCAALTKNEGIALIVAAAIALGPRKALRLWPAAVVAAPWLVVRWSHHLVTDLATGSISARVIEHLRHPEFIPLLFHYAAGKPLLWLGVILSLIAAARRWIQSERFLLIVIALQTTFYIGAYVVTPLDLAFHIRWSWDRLVSHITPLIVFVALVTALQVEGRTPSSARGEAVLEQ
jgi:hypothetical protein